MSVQACTGCGQVKACGEFPVLARNADGSPRKFRARCRECALAQKRVAAAQRRAFLRDAAPVDREPRVRVPSAPLVAAIDREIARELPWHDNASSRVLRRCRVDEARVRTWRRGECQDAHIDLADRVMIGLGLLWWEVYPPDEFPGVARIFEPEAVAA